MLLHVIILVPKRKEKKKIYIYISPNAKPLHNNRFLSSRILSCITWFQHAWCAIRSFLPFTIYIHFSPHVKFQSHEFLYSPSIGSRSIINRSSSEIFSLHPSLRWDANKKETRARKMHRSKKNEWHRSRSLSRLRTSNYAEENKPINRDSINKTKSSPRVMNDTIEKKGERGDLSLFSRRSILPLHSRFLCEGPAIP